MLSSVEPPRCRLSGLESPMLEPLAVDPNRSVAPAANSMASAILVFPAPAGPTSAITRVPLDGCPAMRLSLRAVQGRASRTERRSGAAYGSVHRPPVFKRWQVESLRSLRFILERGRLGFC